MTAAVVTGAGRGLGRGIAVALAASGFDIIVGYRDDADAASGTAGLVEAQGRRAKTVQGDIADPSTANRLLDAACTFGGLGAWVNNAGVSMLAPILDTTVDDLTTMLGANVIGTFHGMQAAARAFLADGRPGRIVNLASDLGVQAAANLGAYSATKFAVVGLTQAAAVEWAADSITINAVCPGTAETDMVLAERQQEAKLSTATTKDIRNAYLDAIPAGRFCTPEDVGGLVAWLCGGAAGYVTGQAICINGASILH